MPKTKAQGILFGLIMSYSMAIGMEIYNTASALGFAQQPGGLSNLRSHGTGLLYFKPRYRRHGHLRQLYQP